VGYGCWHVARLLVARGARVDGLWTAAALGLLSRIEEFLAPGVPADQLNETFWQACHGGQRRAAELLLDRGADPSAIPRLHGADGRPGRRRPGHPPGERRLLAQRAARARYAVAWPRQFAWVRRLNCIKLYFPLPAPLLGTERCCPAGRVAAAGGKDWARAETETDAQP